MNKKVEHELKSANRLAKNDAVSTIVQDLDGAELVVVVQQNGLNADETRKLRVQTHAANVGLKVGKNTLVKHAVQGTKFEGISAFLGGPTALAFSKDPISAAKVVVEFAKKNDKLKILGATMGDKVLDAMQTKALASLPSLNELRGKIVGLLQAPATKIACIMVAPAGQLARVISAKSRKQA